MIKQEQLVVCKKCSKELVGPFCSFCGHPQKLKRISGTFILSEIVDIFNFQKGIFFSVKELFLRPNISIKKYIHEDRSRLVKPISFIILTSLIYIISQQFLQFQDGYINYTDLDWQDSATSKIMHWISNNYGLGNILMANFIAIWTKLFFRKYNYNLFEILILLYFVLGIQMLMFSIFGIAESLSHLNILDRVSIIAFAYVCWAIARFFDAGKKINYLKGFLSYLFGMVSFVFGALLLGAIIDFFSN